MSLWTKGRRADSIDINSWKLSLALAKKSYGFVNLVTDTKGQELLKDLPFTNVYNILDDIENFPNVWILGKIYAYQYACSKGVPFFHLDSDFYIWKPFPKELTDSDIFAQCQDTYMKYVQNEIETFAPQYDVNSLKQANNTFIPDIWQDYVFTKRINFQPINMGVFGGRNLDLINEYCGSVLDMIRDARFKNIWQSEVVNNFMVEQFHLGIFELHKNINVKFLHGPENEGLYYRDFVHMHGLRTIEPFKSAIAARVQQDPYDLIPKSENKEVKEQTGIINFPV